ncbi:MAG: NAD-binding protein [Ignavibacteriaceae bacterium]|nr:NAD-binding protein [Ignavibacteriaceae bacterium]
MKIFERRTFFLGKRTSRRNAILISRLVFVLLFLLAGNSVLFRYLMNLENRDYSWITCFYWTATNMSTLGLGDITFQSDPGRLFNVYVAVSGLAFILILVPFTFIKLFQSTERIHRELPRNIKDHVILTNYDHVSQTLIRKLKQFKVPYVLLIPDLKEAGELIDKGLNVVSADLDDGETYKKVQINQSAGVVLTGNHFVNTSATYAIRQVTKEIAIVSTADSDSAEEVLLSSGATNVIKLGEMMGKSLARRITAGDALAHDIEFFDKLKIAEATVKGTPLANKTLRESNLRELAGVSVVGIWNEGKFSLAKADTKILERSVLVLAGSPEQIDMYNEMFCIYNVASGPVLVIGGGKVGRAVGKILEEREIDFKLIEKEASLAVSDKYITGDASDKELLLRSGLMTSPAVAITTEDDNMNIFLTTLIRKFRPDIQIISRGKLDRTVELLYGAGCDFVMSYASMGANSIFNLLKKGNILMIAEGVDVFKVDVPRTLAGLTIRESSVREKSGCSIVALASDDDIKINPNPSTLIEEGQSIILIGNFDAETKFFSEFMEKG